VAGALVQQAVDEFVDAGVVDAVQVVDLDRRAADLLLTRAPRRPRLPPPT